MKWANDELDGVPDLCAPYFTGTTLEGQYGNLENQMVAGYRRLRSQDLAIRIDGACASHATTAHSNGDPAADVDTAWDADERHGVYTTSFRP